MSYNDVLHQSEQCSLGAHSAPGARNVPDKAKTKSINPCAERFRLTDSVDAGTFPLIITQSFILRGYIRNIHLLYRSTHRDFLQRIWFVVVEYTGGKKKQNKKQCSKHNTIIEFMIYTPIAQFNIFLERKHEIHLLFTLYKKKS